MMRTPRRREWPPRSVGREDHHDHSLLRTRVAPDDHRTGGDVYQATGPDGVLLPIEYRGEGTLMNEEAFVVRGVMMLRYLSAGGKPHDARDCGRALMQYGGGDRSRSGCLRLRDGKHARSGGYLRGASLRGRRWSRGRGGRCAGGEHQE